MLSALHNKRFNRIGRAIDMMCLFLGEDYSFACKDERRIEVEEYSFHFQTQWRFRENGKILLASRDIYEPFNENVPENWEYDLFGRPDELSSVFDVYSKNLNAKMQGAVVQDCYLSTTNDVIIHFSNGVVFEQFTPSSQKDEEWRLIDYIHNTHTVCYNEEGNISCE